MATPSNVSQQAVLALLIMATSGMYANAQPLTTHLPLCDPRVVEDTCFKLQPEPKNGSSKTIGKDTLAELLSADPGDIADALATLGLQSEAPDYSCQAVCDGIVSHVKNIGGVLPPTTDMACVTIHGATSCDVDADPYKLASKVSGALAGIGARMFDFDVPAAGGDEPDASPHASDGGASQQPRSDDEPADVKPQPRTEWETLWAIAGFFRMFPSNGQESLYFHSAGGNASLEGPFTDPRLTKNDAEAKIWMAIILSEMNNGGAAHFQQIYFGGPGRYGFSDVKRMLLQRLNFIYQALGKGVHYVFPSRGKTCGIGAVAFVWSTPYSRNGGFRPGTGPRCSPNDDPNTHNCGIDTYGRYYINVCAAYLEGTEGAQIACIIHELSHQGGTLDYEDNPRGLPQLRQLGDSYAYQHFSQDLVETRYNCKDDPTQACVLYQKQGYCQYAHIQAACRQTCGVCQLPQPCTDGDPNCGLYASQGYCNTEHIKKYCRKSCGLCLSASNLSSASGAAVIV